MEVTKSFFLIN